MRFRTLAPLMVFVLLAGCKRETAPEEAPAPADTTQAATGSQAAAPGGATAEEAGTTTMGGPATVATSASGIGAPEPPGGYAVDSRPAEGAQLARIEFATPKTVTETAEFYDTQMRPAHRVQLEVGGDDMVVYGLSPSTTITAATTYTDVQRLLNERSEPILVISAWTLPRNDPLIRDLRNIGQSAQADALLQTKSKVTVVYAVR